MMRAKSLDFSVLVFLLMLKLSYLRIYLIHSGQIHILMQIGFAKARKFFCLLPEIIGKIGKLYFWIILLEGVGVFMYTDGVGSLA